MMIDNFEKTIQDVAKRSINDDPRYTTFYEPFFESKAVATSFIKKCTEIEGNVSNMMLQACWLITIADDLEKIRPQRPALRILFLASMAESISKLATSHKVVGNSRDHYCIFFDEISKIDETRLCQSLRHIDTEFYGAYFDRQQALDIFYNLRNVVLHEGLYFNFNLHDGEATSTTITNIPVQIGHGEYDFSKTIETTLGYELLRGLFARTAIANIQKLINNDGEVRKCKNCPK